jgi:hypothetical protein
MLVLPLLKLTRLIALFLLLLPSLTNASGYVREKIEVPSRVDWRFENGHGWWEHRPAHYFLLLSPFCTCNSWQDDDEDIEYELVEVSFPLFVEADDYGHFHVDTDE